MERRIIHKIEIFYPFVAGLLFFMYWLFWFISGILISTGVEKIISFTLMSFGIVPFIVFILSYRKNKNAYLFKVAGCILILFLQYIIFYVATHLT